MPSTSHILKLFSFALLLGTSYSASAGGPLVIEGPAGHTPVTYANPNIVLNLDPGPLGSRSNAAADTLIRDAFALWNNVSTSTISLTQGNDLSTDITSSNFELVIPNAALTQLHENDGLNPIVYDNDGSIIDGFFGVGASLQTVGFAASIIFVGQSNFVEGYAVINGRDIGLTDSDFTLLVAHELGHLFGLDHTQTDINNAESMFGSPGICQTAPAADYAIMYPFVCRKTVSLHADDISTVSQMYPSAEITQQYGAINGRFLNTDGSAILGANIWAENTITGEIISTVSDYLKEGNGAYRLIAPAGQYTLHANSINPLFNAGSGIGPYTSNAFDLSFKAPHPIVPVGYQGNTAGNNEIITVNNNGLSTINFIADGSGTSTPVVSNALSSVLFSAISTASAPSSGSSGGGTLSPLSVLFLALSLLVVRRKA